MKDRTERACLGDPSMARGLDITALYAQHDSDGYELYARHSNHQLVRMLKAVGFDVGFCRGEARENPLPDRFSSYGDGEDKWRIHAAGNRFISPARSGASSPRK